MVSQVNIGDAKTRLSELVAAAVRGEEIVLARAGEPQVRLVPLAEASAARGQRMLAKRRAALGMLEQEMASLDLSLTALKAGRGDFGERERRLLEPPA